MIQYTPAREGASSLTGIPPGKAESGMVTSSDASSQMSLGDVRVKNSSIVGSGCSSSGEGLLVNSVVARWVIVRQNGGVAGSIHVVV